MAIHLLTSYSERGCDIIYWREDKYEHGFALLQGSNMILIWIGFLICTSAIVYAGIKLYRYGDIIAEKTGLGRTWIGVVIMASVTSLPELVTGISSGYLRRRPGYRGW